MKPILRQTRLTGKLFLIIFLSSALPLLASSVIYFTVFYSLNRQVSREILSEKTHIAKLLMDSKLEAFSRKIEALSVENMVTINIELNLPLSLSDYLSRVVDTEDLDDITVWNTKYEVLAVGSGTIREPHSPSFPDMSQWENHPTVASTDGYFYFQTAKVLTTGTNATLGLISARLGFDSLCASISREVDAPVIALDPKGGVIARAGNEGPFQLGPGPVTTFMRGKLDGRELALEFFSVSGPDGKTMAWIGTAYSSEQLNRFRDSGALFLGLILIGLYFSMTITRPIQNLARTAKEMSGGTYSLVAEIDQDDEIGDLAKNFNTMSRSLEEKATELESTRSYLDNVVNSLPSSLVAVDREGAVTQWNAAAVSLASRKKEDAIGKKIWDLLPFLHDTERRLQDVIQTRRPTAPAREHISSRDLHGNEMRSLDVSIYPLVHNCVEGAVFRFDDVTELEGKETQLRQAQKMEMIGSLTSGIAHDFNNILTGIMGNASLLSLQLAENRLPPDPEIASEVDSMLKISLRAKDLVKQLLSLSRRQEITLKEIDLSGAIDSAVKICRTSFDKSISVSVSYPAGPAITLADQVLIEQVLLNICINASHAMTIMRPDGHAMGGKLEISLEHFDVNERFCSRNPLAVVGPYWVIKVSDSGVGIPPAALSKIFNPFFTTKPAGQGTGLGLSTAYGIVRQHDGFIDVYSIPGSGTTFSVYLPDRAGKGRGKHSQGHGRHPGDR
jgi:PAS domain S-box-containing protein